MKTEVVDYQCHKKILQGQLFYNEQVATKRPAVIVAHAWKGRDQFALEKAKMLADLGFAGFAADLYGNGKVVESNEEALEQMLPLFMNRKLLRDRIVSAYHAVSNHPLVDTDQIGAVGFCFGGATVLELLRSGVNLKGIVSFHGLLGDALGEQKAQTVASADSIHGSLLILHGYHDPLVSLDDIVNTQKEFADKNVDWQMHIYGNATHAFTNPDANEPGSGLLYHAVSEKRALRSMQDFFREVFA